MGLNEIWHSYTAKERRNIAFYVSGLMLYKLSFEIWTGSLTTIALNRHGDSGGEIDENTPVGFLGGLQSLNLVFQCFGAVLVAWGLRMGWGTKGILIWMVLCGVGVSGALVGLDVGTGGRWKREEGGGGEEVHGGWDARILVLIFAAGGVVAGGVELVRKVVPREVLGEEEVGKGEGGEREREVDRRVRMGNKLRRVDAMVHIFYELAGTGGAFLSADLNMRLGSNFAVVVVPGVWLLACVVWLGMRVNGRAGGEEKVVVADGEIGKRKSVKSKKPKLKFGAKIRKGFLAFFATFQLGLRLLFSSPQYAWLPIGYSVSLYAHRYLENGLAPAIAKYVYNESAFYQIIVGGSNLGELLGALAVFVLTEHIQSPLPWVRLDAVMLAVIWAVVKWRPPIDSTTGKVPVVWAWELAAIFLPISLGWAAGDVSLVAHIQTNLSAPNDGDDESGKDTDDSGVETNGEREDDDQLGKEDSITSLGAVMAVLYSTYIALFALLNPLLGIYTDKVVNRHASSMDVEDQRGGIWEVLFNVGGVQFSVIAVLVMGSTFLPLMREWPWKRRGVREGEDEGQGGVVLGEVLGEGKP